MIEKNAQFIFKEKVKGRSMIQLMDGKIMIYSSRESYIIFIYNEKTFQQLYNINLLKQIEEFKERKDNIKKKVKKFKKMK